MGETRHPQSEPNALDAKLKYERVKFSSNRIVEAVQHAGFYLEAITLIESLIVRGLESRVERIYESESATKKPPRGLSNLLKHLKDEFPQYLEGYGPALASLLEWVDGRNSAIHGLAKWRPGDPAPLEVYTKSETIFANGAKALLLFDTADAESRTKDRLRSATVGDDDSELACLYAFVEDENVKAAHLAAVTKMIVEDRNRKAEEGISNENFPNQRRPSR